MQFCHTKQCHRCILFWGSVQLACELQQCPPELLPENWMLITLPQTPSNVVLENLALRPTGLTTADHVQPGQPRTSTWEGYGMGRHKATDNEHNCILSMAISMHIDTLMRSWGPLSCYSSAAITSCFSMIMPGPMSTCTTVCSSSRQHPATSHSHWTGVEQHSTGHNQQPEQLYVKEMCRAAWVKCWSHQILTGFLIHAPTFKKKVICDQQMHICIPSHV